MNPHITSASGRPWRAASLGQTLAWHLRRPRVAWQRWLARWRKTATRMSRPD